MGSSVDFASLIPDLNFDNQIDDAPPSGTPVTDPDILAQLDNFSDNVAQGGGNPYLAAQIKQESGGKDYDKSGNVLTSPKGAKGKMQVLDSTDLDPGYGVTPAKDDSLEERARVGRDYSAALQKHYGDPALGLAAYNWGPGNVDKWLKNGANPDHLPTETKTYVKNILGAGRQYSSADTGTQTDAQYDNTPPSGTPVTDPDLIAQLEAAPESGTPVTDPAILAQLDSDYSQPSDLPGLSAVPNLGQPAAAPPITQPDIGPQVPVYGADGVTPISPKAASPTDSLMLAGPTPQPDFFDREKADIANRAQQASDIDKADALGQNSTLDSLYQKAGVTAGTLLGDPFMNAAGSLGRMVSFGSPDENNLAGKYNLTDLIHGGTKAAADGVSPYVNPGIKEAGTSIADYVKSNPLLQRNLSATNDIAMAVPFLKPARALLGATDDGIVGAAKALTPAADADVTSRNFLTNQAGTRRGAELKAPIPTGDELASDASAIYKSLPADAEALDAPSVNKFAADISEKAPQTRAGKIVAGDNALTKIVDRIAGKVDPETGERIGGLKGQPMTMAEAQEVDEALGDHIDDLTDGTTGRLTKQGKKVLDIQTAFRKAIQEGGTEGGDQLALARAKWAQASRMRDIERINARAELMENPITARKTGYRNLYLRLQKNSMGYSPQEIALVKRAADSGVATNMLKLMGSRLGPLMAGAAGTATGGVLGGMAAYGTDYAISGAARGVANKIHLGRDTAVKRAIAERPMPVIRPQTAAAEVAPASPEAPKQITFQPDIIAGSGAGAVARPATGEEMGNAEAARRLRIELGLDNDPQAARKGAASSSFSIPDSSLDKPGMSQISPKDVVLSGTQDLDARSNSTILPEPSGISSTAKNSPKSLRGDTENLTDINNTPTNSIYHDIANKATLISKAQEAEKPAINMLKQATSDVPGVKVLGSRLKDLDTLNQKIEKKGRQPSEISDYLGTRLQIDDAKAASHAIGNIARKANITHVDDFLNDEGRPGTGYRAIHIQIKNPDGFSYETQFVPKELMDVYDQERALHNKWKDYRGDIPKDKIAEHLADKAAAKKLFDDAWDKYKARTGEGGGATGGSQPKAYQPEVKAPISEGKPIKIHAHGEADTAITPTGEEFDVKHAVVSGDDLIVSNLDNMRKNPDYPQILQPRDRTSAKSRMQITDMVNEFNPRRFMHNPLSSEGSPIISKDGVVESGNGRTLAIKRVFANEADKAAKYRQALKNAGYDIRGIKNPILVRVRETPMTDAERVKIAQDSNRKSNLGMSSVEQAAQDAGNLSPSTLDKYRGGDLKLYKNSEFVKSALKDIASDNEMGSILGKDGNLSQEAERRVESALLHKAYGDEDITRLLTEGTDNELTTLGRALTHAAPVWAKMRNAVANKLIPAGMDVTPMITDAAKIILEARRAGNPVSDYLRTDDLLKGKVPQEVRDFLDFLHQNNKMTKFISHDKIVDGLSNYANEALKTQPGVNLYGEKPLEPSEILKSSYKKALGKSDEQPNFFGTED